MSEQEHRTGVRERRSNYRRKKDRELAVLASQAIEASQTAVEVAKEAASDIKAHIIECAENYDALRKTIAPVAAYVQPQIRRAEARAKVWQKVYETVATEAMSALIKWGTLFAVAVIIFGSIPVGHAVIRFIKATMGMPAG